MTSITKCSPVKTSEASQPPKPKVHLNIDIEKDKYRLYLTAEENPLDKRGALKTLKKIEVVFAGVEAGKLHFEPTPDFRRFSDKDALDFLESQASKIKKQSKAMSNSLVSLVSLTSGQIESTSKKIDRSISRRNGAKLDGITKPLVTEIGSFLGMRDIAALGHVNHELSDKALPAILQRAKKYGYRGYDINEAKHFLSGLFAKTATWDYTLDGKFVGYRNKKVGVGAIISSKKPARSELSDSPSRVILSPAPKSLMHPGENEKVLIKLSKKQITGREVIDICCKAQNQEVNSFFLKDLDHRQITPGAKEVEEPKVRSLFLHYLNEGNTSLVEVFLKSGVNPNSAIQAENGEAALHIAVRRGNLKTVELLLKAGAKVDALNNKCMTPLHIAIASGNLEIAKLLLNAKADVNARNQMGMTPFHFVQTMEAASLLIASGAQPNATTISGHTLLHLATFRAAPHSFVLFLTKYIDVNVKNISGATALHHAKDIETFQILQNAGASLGTLNEYGYNPLHAAIIDGCTSIPYLKFLLQIYDVNAVDKYGRTALHLAYQRSNLEIINCLLEAGANISIKDKSGMSPISYAFFRADASSLSNSTSAHEEERILNFGS